MRVSIQTTLARAEARGAEEGWAAHKFGCARCSEAQHTRHMDQACPDGWKLYRHRRDALAGLARQRELDRQPIDGQGELFTEGEIASMRVRKGARRDGA